MRKTNRYMFSESANILCVIEESTGRYYVCNGAWYGIRDGDKFTIEAYPHKVLTITDWRECTEKTAPKGYYIEYGDHINLEYEEEDRF